VSAAQSPPLGAGAPQLLSRSQAPAQRQSPSHPEVLHALQAHLTLRVLGSRQRVDVRGELFLRHDVAHGGEEPVTLGWSSSPSGQLLFPGLTE